jgi:uncharacterized protein (TIGR03083 family)
MADAKQRNATEREPAGDPSPDWIDLETARTVALRELWAFVSLVESLGETDWARPTPLPGWAVRDLVEHFASVPGYDYFAGRMRGARLGDKSGPSANANEIEKGLSTEELVALLRQRSTEFETELGFVTEDDLDRLLYVMPGRRQLLRSALGGCIFECGLHHYDLATALGHTVELPPDVCRGVVLMAQTDGFRPERRDATPRLATPPPDEDVSYVLAGDTVRWEFSFTAGAEPFPYSPTQNGRWTHGVIHDACCTVDGTDSAICLVLAGRLTTHDERVSATEGFVPRSFTCW